jgi:DNA-binding transcriptional LysR family regulator
MERHLSLDDIALFVAVADAGGLAGAARATRASVPTLSRRMTELERQTGRRLFQRGRRGYALTAEGRALLEEAEALRALAGRLARWRAQGRAAARVRITAGLWTSRFLARHIRRVWSPGDAWVPEFLASNADVDIARREADIGLRNRRPEQSWLAGQRTMGVDFAAYAADPEVAGFVALPESAATTPSELWVRRTHGDAIVTTASDMRLALDLALAGIGRIVMPCFAGDAEPGLVRVSEPIAELASHSWLVSHHDSRHDPPVRAALDAIHRLLTDPALRGGGTAKTP